MNLRGSMYDFFYWAWAPMKYVVDGQCITVHVLG